MNKKTKGPEEEIIFYPAVAYRRYPDHEDVVESMKTHSFDEAEKRTNRLYVGDNGADIFAKIHDEWYLVRGRGRTQKGNLLLRKELGDEGYELSDVLKEHEEMDDLER